MKITNLNNIVKRQFFSVFLLAFIFVGCKTTYQVERFNAKNIPKVPDYSKESSWVVLPNKYPESLQSFVDKDVESLKADVFYVYPTLLLDKKDVRWNVPVDDQIQKNKIIN